MRRIAIVGGTSGIAVACARRWNQGAVHFVLLGRSAERLEVVAQDLRVRNPVARVDVEVVSLVDASGIAAAVAGLLPGSDIDLALIAHGVLPDQATMSTDLDAAAAAFSVNATSPALFAEALAGRMERAGHGALVVLGSVAGDRGRKSNYTYGAAKSLLETYVRGLQHRLASSAVKVLLVKPGPTATPMTAHLEERGLAAPTAVAEDIDRAVRAGSRTVYTPRRWRPIMGVIRALPDVVFDRLDI